MKPRARAIIIEDSPSCRALLEMLLEQRGYEVISLADPMAGPLFGCPQCTCPRGYVCGDFLLTDNRMPGMTGLEFVERQTNGGCRGIVANKAVFSGSWDEEDLAKVSRLGCRVFDKPFNLNEISAWLDEREKDIPPERKLVSFGSDRKRF
jgi:CheY-like chemotaxis protein